MLVTIHLKLQKLKSNISPFGGMNIMFTDDFLQFSPINDTQLYLTNIQPTFAFIKQIEIIYIHPNNIICQVDVIYAWCWAPCFSLLLLHPSNSADFSELVVDSKDSHSCLPQTDGFLSSLLEGNCLPPCWKLFTCSKQHL
jgi:hypothetical protein